MDKQKLVDAVIEEMKRDLNEYNDSSCLYQLLYDNVDLKILEQYLPEGQDQTIEQLEAQEQVNQLLTKGYWENENLYE